MFERLTRHLYGSSSIIKKINIFNVFIHEVLVYLASIKFISQKSFFFLRLEFFVKTSSVKTSSGSQLGKTARLCFVILQCETLTSSLFPNREMGILTGKALCYTASYVWQLEIYISS